MTLVNYVSFGSECSKNTKKEFRSQLTNNAAKFQEYNTSLLVLKDPTDSRYEL